MTHIVKETLNYLRVATQYFASQKGFIFRGEYTTKSTKKHEIKIISCFAGS